ncbi:MAG: hypothetical protein IPK83_13090 [Planctomycetes bacterium]|nr:hypothetical protein [Planctomycetota bacterium]
MTLQITLNSEAEERLRRRAQANGEDVAVCAAQLIQEALREPSLDEVLAPVRKAFEESGMTEDELSDLLEREKHAMRAERRQKESQ